MTEFATARLRFRPYTPADEDSFVALFSDDAVTPWMGLPGPDLRGMYRRGFEPGRVTWDIWRLMEGDTYVGHAELKPSPAPQVDGHELVYALAPAVWGRGLGTEVASAVTTYGFEVLGLTEVHATVDPSNAGSLKVLRRIGYVDTAEFLDKDGDRVLVLTKTASAYVISRGSWPSGNHP
jgi:RimJ/RimL family protein N-acetyltransferase